MSASLTILVKDFLLSFLGFIFIVECQEHETETTPALRDLVSHHDGVIHLAEGLEVIHEIGLLSRESEAAHK